MSGRSGGGRRETGAEPTRGHRDPVVRQMAMDLMPEIDRLTRSFPQAERCELTAQPHRAAMGIPMDIAEGQARRTTADFARFLAIARGSPAEVDTVPEIARRLGHLTDADCAPARSLMLDIRRMPQALIATPALAPVRPPLPSPVSPRGGR